MNQLNPFFFELLKLFLKNLYFNQLNYTDKEDMRISTYGNLILIIIIKEFISNIESFLKIFIYFHSKYLGGLIY